jgi:hypothetical protein
MADFYAALRLRLLTDVNVRAIVDGKRIFWTIVPAGTARPYIRLQAISDPRPQLLDEYEDGRTTRVQCDIFADTHSDATALAEAVIAAVAEPGEFGGVLFGNVRAEGPRDLGEDGDQGFIHRASIDLLAEHSRA